MVTRYNFFMMEGGVWAQDAGKPASWENSRRVNPRAEFVAYADYVALQQTNLAIKTALASQVSDLLAQVTKLTEDLAAYQNSYGPAVTEALREAQITGLAFIRVNANGHVQALPSDRVRISVIQAVEERTAAASHQECDHQWFRSPGTGDIHCVKCRDGSPLSKVGKCDHDYQSEFNGVGYDDICSKCGDTRPEECDHLWVVGPSCGPVPEYLECVKCRKQKPLGEGVCE